VSFRSNNTMNILVTGGAGYIGSHTCKALAREGYKPITYDNLVYGHPWAVKWGPLEEGDIADRTRLDEVILKHRPEAVVHFAAYTYVGESVENPAKYYRNNVAGTLTLLEAMRDHGIDEIIFSSTCAVYGNPDSIPIAEDHAQQPISPYGASKQMIERILRDFDRAHRIRSVSLRYFNAAGADPEGDIGEDHDPETHLIPLVIQAALGQRSHLEIYGTDYPTPDGTAIRDYIHVTDLAEAHVKALSYLENKGTSLTINLGTGKGYSAREVISGIERVAGRPVPARNSPRRPGDSSILLANAKQASKTLNWQPRYTDIDPIVESAWRWHKSLRDKP